MEQVWNEIIDFPNYEASNDGFIRRKLNSKILKTKQNDNRPYEYVTIFSGGKKYTKKIEKLVWMAFNGCDCKKTIDHIDRNPKNNSIQNLRCISLQENCMNRLNFGHKKNKYNLTDEIKKDIITRYRRGQITTWGIMKEYGIPINYMVTIIRRGSWDKLINGQ
jgi:hypothetical protein